MTHDARATTFCSVFTICLMQESNGAEVAPEFLRDLTVVRAAA